MWGSFRFDRICGKTFVLGFRFNILVNLSFQPSLRIFLSTTIDTRKRIESEFLNTSWTIPNNTFPVENTDLDFSFTLPEGTTYYEFCNSEKGITRDQSRIISIFDYLTYVNIGIISLVVLIYVGLFIKSYFYTKYEVSCFVSGEIILICMFYPEPICYLLTHIFFSLSLSLCCYT